MGAGEDSLEPAQAEPNLLARSSWVRLEIMGGRLAVLSQRCGQSRSVREEDPERAKQSLSVQLRGHALVVHYLFEDYLGRRELTVDEEGTVRVAAQRYESEPREVVLTQPASGKLKLRIVHGGDNDEFSATSLWHLMLSEPELFEHHAAPLLTSIRPDWRIAEQGAAIRESLLNAAGRDVLSERNQWKKWVEELSHPNFAKRQAADAALRAVGQPVIAWLGRLEANELDAAHLPRPCGPQS
jgi:hypothetical protein